MKDFRKWFEFPRILLVVAFVAFLAGILTPTPSYHPPPVVNTSESLMRKIFKLVSKEMPREQILNSLTQEEKEMLRENRIDWIESVPVRTPEGAVKPEYLPFGHVVVYGFPELRSGKKRWRAGFFLNALCQQAYVGTKKYDVNDTNDTEELQKLIHAARAGTFDVLLGNAGSIGDLSDVDKCDTDVLYEYLILKKLVINAPDAVEYAITVMTEKSRRLEIRADKLLRKYIVTPRPPDPQLFYTEAFRVSWKKWYAENFDKIQVTNEFLFENGKSSVE
jgi:hypothetical protein